MASTTYWISFLAIFCVEAFATWYNDVQWYNQEECMRPCNEEEEPRICYYVLTVEYASTMGPICDVCLQEQDHTLRTANCDCIMADGVEKSVLVFNNTIPGPSIQVCKNDYVVIDVVNNAEGLETSIHWHGIFQKGYQYYDGVPFLTQCPIHSSNSFRYQFQVNNPGTHFYHSHISLQMMDGLYGSFIVRDFDDPNAFAYDEDRPEHVILLSDLMHELSLDHYPGTYRNETGQIPDNVLINGFGSWTDPQSGEQTNTPLAEFNVMPGVRYRFRMINSFSSVCLAEFNIEGHNLTVIATDGENVRPKTVDRITSASGERVDFVINGDKPSGCYWIEVRAIAECEERRIQQFAFLKYDGASCESKTKPSYDVLYSFRGIELNSINATNCDRTQSTDLVCMNQLVARKPEQSYSNRAYYRLELGFSFYTYRITNHLERYFVAPGGNVLTSMVSNVSYVDAPAPPISQREGYERMCRSPQYGTCTEPCFCTHVVHVPRDVILDILLCDEDPLATLHHPFHLHGYAFEVREIEIYATAATSEDKRNLWQKYTENAQRGLYRRAPKKDTLKIPKGGCAIIRVYTDNPGWWLFHCHFLWHTMTGMNIVLHVGDRWDLPPVPAGFPKCYNWLPPLEF